MAEQKVKLTELPTATDTLDTAQLLVNQNSTDQKLAITHLLRAKNNLSELEDFAQARANLDVPSVEEVNNKLSGFIDGSYTFSSGGSLASRSDFIWDEDTKSWYYWSGVLPKEVPAASNPDSTGGTGVGAWIPVGESVLRGDLSKPTGSSLIGYKYSASVSIARTVQDKLGDFVFLEDFGGKADNGITDNSHAFLKAFQISPRVMLRDAGVYAMKTRDVELPAYWEVIGNGMKTEIKYLGTDATFTIFTANGTGPEDNQQKPGGVFRDVIVSSNIELGSAFVFRHIKHCLFERTFFYNAGTVADNFHYVDYAFCQRWSSPFIGKATLNTYNHISEMPRWINCFSSSSPIDLEDTTDPVIIGCIGYSGDFILKMRYTAPALGVSDKGYGFPVHITQSVFDAVKGKALDLEHIAYYNISGNTISAGRDTNDDAVSLKYAYSGSFSNNTMTFCGAYGLRVDSSEQCDFTGNIYNGNKAGGVVVGNTKLCTFSGGAMGTSYVYGGYYVQPIGFTDAADTCRDIKLIGIQFDDDLTSKVTLNTNAGTGNRVLACRGVPDTSISGPSSQRPSGVGMGFYYFDTTLGLPIYWNATSGNWQRADGTNV
ncbi:MULTISPECIES: right-handed parallel beta-helix repeat-containing protein [Enterobacter]|nr:right-handed parallel beta-helix repeat-containing protein [Enterobacter hormaechei]EHF4992788.1 right-handed parallel beta-helix repeat-containing protein [Enterobacter hormaechei]MCM7218263.1 right-handed parallel beta-helix repeat-containing protein [Enterobacter hormaechei]MXS68915.1 right-handed parallel beta-helix repeat-containing protein [Enterobacter hormaechei]HED2354437.1 right-handed parallel beta-helix repeat-containing protein [Enterobacter hormaechei subsp. xiangfangensis]